MYTKPSVEKIIEFVKKYDKRVGLRMLYNEHDIPEGERHKYRKLWNRFYDILPDAFEKEQNDASEIGEAETADGDSGTSSEQTSQEEPRSSEDEEVPTA